MNDVFLAFTNGEAENKGQQVLCSIWRRSYTRGDGEKDIWTPQRQRERQRVDVASGSSPPRLAGCCSAQFHGTSKSGSDSDKFSK